MKNCLVIGAVAFAATSASACSFPPRTDEEVFANANAIFLARITETKLVRLQDPSNQSRSEEVIEARFEVREIIKGTPPASGIVRDVPFAPGNCGLALLPGIEYLLIPGDYDNVLLPSGSFRYTKPLELEAEKRLEKFRALTAVKQR